MPLVLRGHAQVGRPGNDRTDCRLVMRSARVAPGSLSTLIRTGVYPPRWRTAVAGPRLTLMRSSRLMSSTSRTCRSRSRWMAAASRSFRALELQGTECSTSDQQTTVG